MKTFYLLFLKEDYALQDLAIAKLKARGLNTNSLTLILDDLKSQKQRVKTGTSNSFWSDKAIREVDYTKKSLRGLLLFNVFIHVLVILKLATTVILLR